MLNIGPASNKSLLHCGVEVNKSSAITDRQMPEKVLNHIPSSSLRMQMTSQLQNQPHIRVYLVLSCI